MRGPGTCFLEHDAESSNHCPGLEEVGSTESRQKVVKSHFVRQVRDLECPGPFRALLRVEQVVRTDAHIENVMWFDPIRVVVVVFRASLGQRQKLRHDGTCACGNRMVERRRDAAAGESD